MKDPTQDFVKIREELQVAGYVCHFKDIYGIDSEDPTDGEIMYLTRMNSFGKTIVLKVEMTDEGTA